MFVRATLAVMAIAFAIWEPADARTTVVEGVVRKPKKAPEGAPPAAAEPERVAAAGYFGAGAGPNIYIETDNTQVLTLNSKHGDYVTEGRNLDIDAQTVEVTGDVVIRAYKSGANAGVENGVASAGPNGGTAGGQGRNGGPGQNGVDGYQGPKGPKGADAKHVKLKIAVLTGNGTLMVIDDGAGGGRGGIGGTGGNGGNGGKGAGRACGDWLGRNKDGPGDGGAPGNGGSGGVGGIGGDGGAAGSIDYSKGLKQYLDSGKLKLQAKSGTPGDGGPGGSGGAGGTRGDGGDGASCGGGGTPGVPANGVDRRGQLSPNGPKPAQGPDGMIVCYNCVP